MPVDDGYYWYRQCPTDRWNLCVIRTKVMTTKTVRKVYHFHGGQDFLDRYPAETEWIAVANPNLTS